MDLSSEHWKEGKSVDQAMEWCDEHLTNVPVMNMQKQRQTMVFKCAIAVYISSLVAIPGFANSIFPEAAWASPMTVPIGAVKFTLPPPPDRDAPGNRRGAASRGTCTLDKRLLSALVPEYEHGQGANPISIGGTTLAERPTLWFYVPYKKEDINTMLLSLEDESDPAKEPYQTEIVPPDTPGIVSVRLPAAVPPLKVGQVYRWVFVVNLRCEGLDTVDGDTHVGGWIQRISPNAALTSQLKQATPRQQVSLYAQNGIWFDTLTTLADLRLANPQDATLAADWESLLQSIGLQDVAKKPLVQCCKTK